MEERVRVQKLLSAAGLMSRRAAEQAIVEGRVAIDGRIAVLGDRVDIIRQALSLDGIPVPVNPDTETWLLYKPLGVVSTANDTHGRPTVVDLVDSRQRLYPVGRLDMDSEGLILVSNDGELTNRVTHPRYGITKTYLVKVEGSMRPSDVRRLVEGVELDDGPARATEAKVVSTTRSATLVKMIMNEGRNREIRRMMSVLGHEVSALARIAIGTLSDSSLAPGRSRLLDVSETRSLLASGRPS